MSEQCLDCSSVTACRHRFAQRRLQGTKNQELHEGLWNLSSRRHTFKQSFSIHGHRARVQTRGVEHVPSPPQERVHDRHKKFGDTVVVFESRVTLQFHQEFECKIGWRGFVLGLCVQARLHDPRERLLCGDSLGTKNSICSGSIGSTGHTALHRSALAHALAVRDEPCPCRQDTVCYGPEKLTSILPRRSQGRPELLHESRRKRNAFISLCTFDSRPHNVHKC